MIRAKCSLCGKDEEARLIKKEHSWYIVQCKACNHVYLYPAPDKAFLREYYQTYLPLNQKQIQQWKFMMSGVFRKSISLIDKSRSHKKGKLLDIGCGHGFFLRIAKEAGWDAFGLDLCEPAVKYANSKGLNVTNSGLLEKTYKEEEFDAVTMFYVLEHLPDPLEYLREIYRILKKDGILFLRVPHTTPIVKLFKAINIPNKLYDAPSHISDFSPSTIKVFLQKAGFTDIHTYIAGVTYPAPFYKSIISVFFGSLAEFLYWASFKRYLLPGISKSTIARKQ